MTIGEQIKKARLCKNLTAKTLAEEAKISASFLSDIERGRTDPSIDTLVALCKALGLVALLNINGRIELLDAEMAVQVQELVDSKLDTKTMSAFEWLITAKPEHKKTLYDELKSFLSSPEVFPELIKGLKKVQSNNDREFDFVDLTPDKLGSAATELLIQWIEAQNPQASDVLDSIIEKIEVNPREKTIRVHYRDSDKDESGKT